MKKHFVTFLSPGTFVNEESTKEIDSWNVDQAKGMAGEITERHNAKPFAFYFTTRERKESDLDSKQTEKSPRYYLGGKVLTLADVEARNDPNDETLIWNMRVNNIEKVLENTNSWRTVQTLSPDDVVLDYPPSRPPNQGPTMKMYHGTYVGDSHIPRGNTALLREDPVTAEDAKSHPMWLAQFDNTALKEAFGWHLFERSDFVLDPEQ